MLFYVTDGLNRITGVTGWKLRATKQVFLVVSNDYARLLSCLRQALSIRSEVLTTTCNLLNSPRPAMSVTWKGDKGLSNTKY